MRTLLLAGLVMGLAGCASAVQQTRGEPTPCAVTRAQLDRTMERTLYGVMERECRDFAAQRDSVIHVVVRDGMRETVLGYAPQLRSLVPEQAERVHYLPAEYLVVVEVRIPRH